MGHVVSTQRIEDPFYPGSFGKAHGAGEAQYAVYPPELVNDKQATGVVHAMTLLYGGSEEDMAKAARQLYDPQAIFHDHFVHVTGHDAILANNTFWTKDFAHGANHPFAVVKMPPGSSLDHGGGGCYILCVHHTGNCTWSPLQALGFSYVYYATAVLVVRASDGKVMEHYDIWHNIPLKLPTPLRVLLGWLLVGYMHAVPQGLRHLVNGYGLLLLSPIALGLIFLAMLSSL